MVRRLIMLASACVLLSGCAALGALPIPGASHVATGPTGILYASTSTPMGSGSVSPSPQGTKVGRAKAMGILGLVAIGDASITAASAAGGIKNVTHVDVETMNILGLYVEYTTVVYGD